MTRPPDDNTPSTGTDGRVGSWLDQPQLVPLRERMAFAAGDVFTGGASSLISVCYLFFLTNIVGLAPGLAGPRSVHATAHLLTPATIAQVWGVHSTPVLAADGVPQYLVAAQ